MFIAAYVIMFDNFHTHLNHFVHLMVVTWLCQIKEKKISFSTGSILINSTLKQEITVLSSIKEPTIQTMAQERPVT